MSTPSCVGEWPAFGERCNTSEAKASFQKRGFINCSNYISPSEVERIRSEVERYKRDVVPNLPGKAVFFEDKSRPLETIIRCEGMLHHDTFFNELAEAQVFNGLVDYLLGEECEPNNVQFFCKPPGAKATPPHQDGQYFMHDRGVTLWLALDTATELNGCMYYVEESHKQGLLPHKRSDQLGFSQQLESYIDDFAQKEECMAVKSGCLLGHHPHTVHRTNPNTDKSWRPALGLTYWAKSCKNDADLHRRREQYQQQLVASLEQTGRI